MRRQETHFEFPQVGKQILLHQFNTFKILGQNCGLFLGQYLEPSVLNQSNLLPKTCVNLMFLLHLRVVPSCLVQQKNGRFTEPCADIKNSL